MVTRLFSYQFILIGFFVFAEASVSAAIKLHSTNNDRLLLEVHYEKRWNLEIKEMVRERRFSDWVEKVANALEGQWPEHSPYRLKLVLNVTSPTFGGVSPEVDVWIAKAGSRHWSAFGSRKLEVALMGYGEGRPSSDFLKGTVFFYRRLLLQAGVLNSAKRNLLDAFKGVLIYVQGSVGRSSGDFSMQLFDHISRLKKEVEQLEEAPTRSFWAWSFLPLEVRRAQWIRSTRETLLDITKRYEALMAQNEALPPLRYAFREVEHLPAQFVLDGERSFPLEAALITALEAEERAFGERLESAGELHIRRRLFEHHAKGGSLLRGELEMELLDGKVLRTSFEKGASENTSWTEVLEFEQIYFDGLLELSRQLKVTACEEAVK